MLIKYKKLIESKQQQKISINKNVTLLEALFVIQILSF